MHGLINRAIQRFACDTYGPEAWDIVAREAGLGFTDFEAMMIYDYAVTDATLTELAAHLGRSRDGVLEDLGTYLVSHPNSAGLRRLLRFSGAGYEDFLHSLDELPDRARLTVPDLEMPRLELCQTAEDRFTLNCISPTPGYGHVLVGILRAMADDYGALVTLAHQAPGQDMETIDISLVVASFAEGREFDLGARTG